MSTMRRIFTLVIAAAMAVAMCLCCTSCTINGKEDLARIQKAGVIRIGMECNYAPFNWTQATSSDTSVALSVGGYADGYDVQIAKKIADALGVTLEIVKLDWDGLIPALTSGKIDCIIAGMSPTADRKLTIDFADNYYISELVIVVKKDGAYVNADSLDDFSGAKITGQIDTVHYKVIDQLTGAEKQTAMSDFPTMIAALQSGKIDGYVSELPGAVSAAAANSDLTYIQFPEGAGFVASEEEIAVAVGVRKNSSLTIEINAALEKITDAERVELMNWAIEHQPVSED